MSEYTLFQGDCLEYMRGMDTELVSRLGALLHNELYITFEDKPMAQDDDGRPIQTARKASLMVLIPEGADNG